EAQNGLIEELRQLASDSKFQHIPDTTKESDILYIRGLFGSGKGTCTIKQAAEGGELAQEYRDQFKADEQGNWVGTDDASREAAWGDMYQTESQPNT
ncbi:MAG: hypothetical protein ACKPBF_12915, partial [Actinomycetota bacterium]